MKMHKILKRILEEKFYEIIKRKQKGLYFRPFWDRPIFDLKAYLEKENFTIIAEIKRASPLKGSLRADFNPVKLAESYIKAGAKAISIITEEFFFYGSLEYLAAVRVLTNLPLLRKDFIFDPIQIEEAKAFGADFVLLIADLLSFEDLRELYGYTKKLGLSALTEVHSEDNLEKALSVGVDVIGINNRNLKTLELDPDHAYKLLPLIPKGTPVIAESGISTPEEAKALKKAGFKGVLIGTALVKSENPGLLLNKMVEAL
ncbi:indole-3-glycerol phosphate synthase [Caldimicrobium thiodismutans]|uniref:Indole-3-glycerol phosphate synthase n=2 Tax=Caldimicrobium thiodismutans TaxID=1653476 RepID=A0A0U5B241_9BACT|nr:indole-3-glycerol phosphate synthase [Caldimicrobium thiodismutans]